MIKTAFQGSEQLKRILVKLPQVLMDATNRGFYKVGTLIERQAKFYSPVDTGRLRSSIFTVVGHLNATVATNTEYAIYVHDRTPFLTTAAREVVGTNDVAKIIVSEIEKAL